MDQAELDNLWKKVGLVVAAACEVMTPEELRALEEFYARGTTLAPLLQPTEYIRNAERIENNGELLRAFAAFYRAVRPVRERYAESVT
jgi:hypothetical protein